MTGKIPFSKNYAVFDTQLKPFQKADDVGLVVTEFLTYEGRPFYPFGSIAQAKVAAVWLGQTERPADDEDNLDLIFRMREAEGGHFYEIVRRSSAGTSYGGWVWGQSLEIGDEISSGHRVLTANVGGKRDRFVFDPGLARYVATDYSSGLRKLETLQRIARCQQLSAGHSMSVQH